MISRILSSQASTSGTGAAETASSRRIRSTGVHLCFRASPGDLVSENDGLLVRVVTSAANPTPSETEAAEGDGPLALSARPGKAGYNAFFAPRYLEPMLDRLQTPLRNGVSVTVAVLEEEKQGEANDLGVAVALILLCESEISLDACHHLD